MASPKFSLFILFILWALGLNAAPTSHRHSHASRHAQLMHQHRARSHTKSVEKRHVLFESDDKTQKRSPSPSVGASAERVYKRGLMDDTVMLW